MNRQPHRWCRARACLGGSGIAVGLAVATAAVLTASAQVKPLPPDAPERFEVASIKPNKDPVPGLVPAGSFEGGPGRFRASQATLQELIISAYDLFGFEILEAPNWATRDRFDIVATMSPGPPSEQVARVRRMLRALLAERFNLVMHEEQREMPMYSLVFARSDRALGSRLLPFKGECTDDPSKVTMPDLTRPLPLSDASKGPQLCISGLRVGRIQGRGVALSDLTTMLSRLAAVRRRVVDKTGLSGLFDYDVEWAATLPAGVAMPADRPTETGPDIFTALQEQLGLKLEPGRDPLRVLVVDRVSQPSPN